MADGKVKIERLPTGVPRLDGILYGGFPTRSLNIITGGPGTGKSILALQMLFHQARLNNSSILFVTISEPSIKFLRYAQQFDFFDNSLFGDKVSFFDISTQARTGDPKASFETIQRQVEEKKPALIAIDSFRALRDQIPDPTAARALIYDLVTNLSVWGVTTFLVGEYDPYEISHLPEFFISDAIVNLSVVYEGLRAARRLDVLKLRGSGYVSGTHFFDITPAGIVVYPRVSVPPEQESKAETGGVPRLSTGVAGLDQMLGGGIPARSTTLLEGGTGTGKTLLALSFLVEGACKGEPGLMFSLEETREELLQMGASRGWPLEQFDRQGLLRIIYLSPVELASDAVFQYAKDMVDEMGARRAVLDSLKSLELSIAAEGRLRELVYGLVKTFKMKGVTTILTNEIPELVGTGELSGRGFSSIVDNVIMLRYVEVEARLLQAISVLKVRRSGHERVLRELKITADSIEVLETFNQFQGVLTGVPTRVDNNVGRRRRGKSTTDQS